MRLGIGLPAFGNAFGDASTTAAFAARVEELGYDSLWGAERLIAPSDPVSPYPAGDDAWRSGVLVVSRSADPLLVAAVAVAATQRVRFGFSTLNAPLHHPLPLARALTTLDVLSNGRLDAGFGLGWMRDEYDALGVPWAQRGRRLDDLITFLQRWWTEELFAYDGPFFSVPESRVGLRPVQEGGPAIYLGGGSEAALRRVGRRAAGWLGFEGPAQWIAELWATARRAAEDVGRDPDALRRVVRVNAEPDATVESVVDRVARLAEDGTDEVVVDFVLADLTPEQLGDAAERVMDLRKW